MKKIIVTIRRETTPGLPTMKYPAIYNAREIESDKLGPPIRNGAMAIDGVDSAEILFCVSNALALRYITDSDVRIVNDVQADAWLAINKQELAKPAEEINPGRISAIAVKQAAGIALSPSDLNALDPEHPERGINKKKTTVAEFYPNPPNNR